MDDFAPVPGMLEQDGLQKRVLGTGAHQAAYVIETKSDQRIDDAGTDEAAGAGHKDGSRRGR